MKLRAPSGNYRAQDTRLPGGYGSRWEKGGATREWGIESGEEAGYDHYDQMNDRFQAQAMEQLQRLAAEDEPFFFNYWPMKPVDFNRAGLELKTDNRGSWVESMQVLDGWIGDPGRSY